MTIQQLKYIVALDKERHFGRAAESCLVSQPGLTLQLKSFEEEIGIKIFDRSVQPIQPTIQGEVIINRAKKILHDVESLRMHIIEEKSDLTTPCKVGIISTLGPYLVPLLLPELKQSLPKTKIQIIEMSTYGLMMSLEDGSIDIAIMATPTGDIHLREFPVFNEHFVAYLPDHWKPSKSALFRIQEKEKNKLLLLKEEYCYNSQLLDICSLRKPPLVNDQIDYEVHSVEALKQMVRQGMGFTILPELAVQHEPQKHWQVFQEPRPVREISLVVSENFYRTQLLEKFQQAILSSLPKDLSDNKKFKRIQWNDSPYFKAILESR